MALEYNTNAHDLAQSISSHLGGKLTKSSRGYTCRCPAHDDKTPSLSVSDGENGSPIVHCHAGCSQESVIAALKNLGLWQTVKKQNKAEIHPLRPKGVPEKWYSKPYSKAFPYITQDGEIIGYAVRFEDAEGKTVIPYFKRDGERWVAGAPEEPRTLYGLPSLKIPGPVYVCEGEKSADALTKRGHACVTSQGGSKAPGKSDWSPLAGRDVILWPDNDEPGHMYVETVRANIRGIAKSVRVVNIEAMNPTCQGWDAADWDGVGNIPLLQPVETVSVASGAVPYRMSESGAMKPLASNLALLLGTPELSDCLGWDGLADQPAWRKKPPFLHEFRSELHDQDAPEFAYWAADRLGADFKSQSALEALLVHAKRHYWHPVRDYLAGLTWDKTPRIDSWISDVFGVPDSAYHQAVARSFLIAAVARVMSPGCQVDTMLVLMGDQGIGKSTAVRELLPDFDWYAETTETPGKLDFYQALRGKWIVEVGELNSFRNADWAKIKQMLSARKDTYRASYARFSKDYPRQCMFIGTTNEDEWGRDPSGARRFWPIRCLEANTDYIRAQRDQLWAEAYWRYTAGEGWWTVPDAKEHQESIRESDPWEAAILTWMIGKTGFFSAMDIYLQALGGDTAARCSRSDEMRISHIMDILGVKRERPLINGRRVRVYRLDMSN